jgi:hypothetical protein
VRWLSYSKDAGVRSCKRDAYARASTLLTVIAYHCPPLAVCTPRVFRASAISRSAMCLDARHLREAGWLTILIRLLHKR